MRAAVDHLVVRDTVAVGLVDTAVEFLAAVAGGQEVLVVRERVSELAVLKRLVSR